jgi:hypothetical protein
MARRRSPLTPKQLAEIAEAARRGPDGKPLEEMERATIEGMAMAMAPEPTVPLPPKSQTDAS